MKIARSMNPQSQTTTVVETINFENTLSGLANEMALAWFKLSQFPRARAIAPYFRFYKAMECIWTYTPYNNTYQQDGSLTTGLSIPYIYTVMNRTQDLKPLLAVSTGGSAIAMFQTLGARPKTFTRQHIVRYKPNYLLAGQTLKAASGDTLINTIVRPGYAHIACPDLDRAGGGGTEAVQPVNQVPSFGGTLVSADNAAWGAHLSYVEQFKADPVEPMYSVTLTVKWHFKQPNYLSPGSLREDVTEQPIGP